MFLPIARHGFTLHEGAFRDCCLRYGSKPPSHCIYGYMVQSTMESILHEVRDLQTSAFNVYAEPTQQPAVSCRVLEHLRYKSAKGEVAAQNFWGINCLLRFRIFNPLAQFH